MIDLDELERLEREATKGPWITERNEDDDTVYGIVTGSKRTQIVETDCGYYPPREADAALIVALRNAAPALFAEVRRLSAEVERLEKSTVALSGRYGAALARAEAAESDNARLRGVVEAAKAFMDGQSWAHPDWHAQPHVAAFRAALAAVEKEGK